MYIVSGCLLGRNCKYNGGNNANEDVIEFCKTHKYIEVCPESAAKLPCPRPPAEIVGSKVLNKYGKDLTIDFDRGAELSINTCLTMRDLTGEPIEGAILKANSPSCGCGKIYDGTFTGTLVDGYGVFARRLKRMGIEIITEKETIPW